MRFRYQILYQKQSDARKKYAHLLDPGDIVVVGSNSSRRLTEQELKRNFGLVRCEEDCTRELKEIVEEEESGLIIVRPPGTTPSPATVPWPTTSTSIFITGEAKGLSLSKGTGFPQQTPM